MSSWTTLVLNPLIFTKFSCCSPKSSIPSFRYHLEKSIFETMKYEYIKSTKDGSCTPTNEDSCNATYDYDSSILIIEE